MPRRIEDFRGLTQLSRVKLLHAVQSEPGRRLQELADETGIHVNTAREHLHVLEEEGLVVSRPVATGTRGRPPVVFDPVRSPADNPNADRRIAQALSQGDLLRRIDPSLDQSEELGDDAQHQVDALYSHLDDVGLEPEFEPEELRFEMRPCRYHDLIDEHGDVVCSVHEQLLRQQLEHVPGPLRVEAVRPFVTPHRCRVMLESTERAREDSDPSRSARTRGADEGPRAAPS